MKYINIHCHKKEIKKSEFLIYNLDLLNQERPTSQIYFTAGIHPWWANDIRVESTLMEIKKHLKNPYFVGLGEMGLDFKCQISRQVQEDTFKRQLEFAVLNNIGYIVIHCVRAFNELISIINNIGYTGKLIFHDYRGNEVITRELLKKDSYFTFGKSLFSNTARFRELFHLISDRFFLETDDDESLIIFDVYKKAALLTELSVEDVVCQVSTNFNNCFGARISIS